MRTIIVDPYDPAWPDEFEKIRDYLWPHLSDIALEIVHTGSTSVPGLAAKPIIDFNIVIESYDVFPQIVERLAKLGFEHEGDLGVKSREAFRRLKSDEFMQYHMYVCPKDSSELERQILFRNYLCGHDDARDEYAALKQSLAEKHRHDIEAYVAGKHDFVMNIIDLARSENFWRAIDKLVSESKVIIDRPKGSRHPKYSNCIYPLDYGYLDNTSSMDGNGIDVWKGSGGDYIDAIICTVDLLKRDSEMKILIGCTEDEKQLVLPNHEFMKGILIRR